MRPLTSIVIRVQKGEINLRASLKKLFPPLQFYRFLPFNYLVSIYKTFLNPLVSHLLYDKTCIHTCILYLRGVSHWYYRTELSNIQEFANPT